MFGDRVTPYRGPKTPKKVAFNFLFFSFFFPFPKSGPREGLRDANREIAMKNTRTFLVACSKLKSALIQGILGLENNVY